MKTQNYKNHIQFYPPHHFIFYPIMLVLLGFSIYYSFKGEEQTMVWIFISSILAVIIWLSFMLRQHYALLLQDRIIRTELRFRYYVLTQERLELIEDQLSDAQLFALRFASDKELPGLVKRAIDEHLSGILIKKAITNWKSDEYRV